MAQEVAGLLGVVAVHRRAVPKRVEVRLPQLATPDVTAHVVAELVDDQVAARVVLDSPGNVGCPSASRARS